MVIGSPARAPRSGAAAGERTWRGPRPRALALSAAVLLVLTRLALLTQPLSPDEAGFLVVARQWTGPGSSLYGQYWVDRPPLLLSLFQLAADLGGALPLRLLGIVTAGACLVAVFHAVRPFTGPEWAAVACLTSAAFLANPLIGARQVDGELLAAPFVALGFTAALGALRTRRPRGSFALGVVAGAAGAAAMLIKQNLADVLILLVAVALLRLGGARRRPDPTARAVVSALTLGTVIGAVATAGGLAGVAVARGTSLPGLWFAMYEFRLAAGRVMAADPTAPSLVRAGVMVPAVLASGLAAGVVLLLLALRRPRRRADHPAGRSGDSWHDRWADPVFQARVALLPVLAYDVVSIVLGGSFWSHYLVQLAVPVALAVGLSAPTRRLAARATAGLAVVSAILSTTVAATFATPSTGGDDIGTAVAAAAQPGDTLVALSGHANVNYASGLPSPYPYLWTLPRRTLDPHYTQFRALLRSRRAPTWVVSGPEHQRGTADVVRTHYRAVLRCPDATVYLRRGLSRRVAATCGGSADAADQEGSR